MKTARLTNQTRNIVLTIASAIMIFSFSSCSKKVNFLNSSVVPAAEGSVKVDKDKNKNYVIKIELSNLADPGRLTPPKNVYVVWMVADDNSTKNIGRIKSSTSFLSRRLTGSSETVSAVKPIKIFITAEDDATIQYPLTEVVLSTANF